MATPTTINNIIANIVGMTTTSTTLIPPVLPPSGVAMVLTLGTPFACDDVYVYSILVDGDSGDDNSVWLIEVDDDSGDGDSVDQRKMEQLFSLTKQAYE